MNKSYITVLIYTPARAQNFLPKGWVSGFSKELWNTSKTESMQTFI